MFMLVASKHIHTRMHIPFIKISKIFLFPVVIFFYSSAILSPVLCLSISLRFLPRALVSEICHLSFLDMLYHVSLFVQYHSKSSFVSLFITPLRDFEHSSLLDEFANSLQ
jgi:hypothetical protein